MIDLDERHLSLVREILARHLPGCEVRMFGSRVRGTARAYSDIDLVVMGSQAVPESVMSNLRDAFAESDLPYRVDLIDWNQITPEFRKIIEEQGYEVIEND